MTRSLPNIGLTGGYTSGSHDWGSTMNSNLLKLAVLTQARVLSKVAALPGSPSEGDAHILDENHGTNANQIAVYDNGGWVYFAPVSGWLVFNIDADSHEMFDGTVWNVFSSGSGGAEYTSRTVSFQIIRDAPDTNEQLLTWTPPVGETVTFPVNFAGSTGLKSPNTGTNPASDFIMPVFLDTTQVGSITISITGTVTFSAGSPVVVVGGTNVLEIFGPATIDVDAKGYAFTLLGTKS